MKWLGTLALIVLVGFKSWSIQPYTDDPAYQKVKAQIAAKLDGKKYFAAYKSADKALNNYPEDDYLNYAKAFGLFYSEKNKKILAKYPTKPELIIATFGLLENTEIKNIGEFNKGFSTRLQRGAMKEVTNALKKQTFADAIAILDPWFGYFDNSEELKSNLHEAEVQDTLFNRGKAAYMAEEMEKADQYFNWMHKTFNNGNFQNRYDATTVVQIEGFVFEEYKNPKFYLAHTAKDIAALSDLEKEVIFFHNIVRMDPPLFDQTYVETYYKDRNSLAETDHGSTLRTDLQSKQALHILFHDDKLFKAAEWHATDTGENGITGHVSSDGSKMRDRFTKFGASGSAENCSYGRSDSFDIIMGLLIDLSSERKGHRRNILYSSFKRIGVASRPHKGYRTNIVMDFGS